MALTLSTSNFKVQGSSDLSSLSAAEGDLAYVIDLKRVYVYGGSGYGWLALN